MKTRWIFQLVFTVFIVLSFILMVSCTGETVRIIDATPVLDFGKCDFDINLSDVRLPNPFCFDDENNLYLLDSQNHRVIKSDMKGKFLFQIGEVGQGEENLFKPTGIFIEQNELFVLNNFGREIKRFALDGKFISAFKLEGSNENAKSFFVNGKYIFVNQLGKGNREGKLISIYSRDGKFLRKIGKGYGLSDYIANVAFNNVYFTVTGNTLYGCFSTSPAYFRIGLDSGAEGSLFKKLDFKELKDIESQSIKHGQKPPEFFSKTDTTAPRIFFSIYSNGLAVDGDKGILLYTNIDNWKRGMIFRVDPGGNLKERLLLRFQNIQPRIFHIFSHQGSYFALINYKMNLHLVKIRV